jgi:hypothetical protein
MSLYSKAKLSGAASGNGVIQVAATATPGNTVHDAGTAVTNDTEHDELWLWASNTSAADVVLTLEMGGTGAANEIKVTVPGESTVPVLQGHPIANSLNIDAYAATTNVVNVFGFVNRIRA